MAELLVVDDDRDLRETLAELLRLSGYAVRAAVNGWEGLSMAGAQTPDLIILDVEMPLLDGPGMARVLVTRDAGLEKIPIVLVSGMYDLTAVAAKIRTPYFLAKPYSFETLIELVGRALAERTPPRPSGTGERSSPGPGPDQRRPSEGVPGNGD